MTATQDIPQASTQEAREDFARIVRDAEYGHPTLITRHRETVAVVMHPAAANCPDPDMWQAARAAYDKAITTGLSNAHPVIVEVLAEFGRLLGTYYGEETS